MRNRTVSERVQTLWDHIEAFLNKHRWKARTAAFVLFFWPQWYPAARDFFKDSVAPLFTMDLSQLSNLWPPLSPWNWATIPLGLLVIWVSGRRKRVPAVTSSGITELPETPQYPTVDAGVINPPFTGPRIPAPEEIETYPIVQLFKHDKADAEVYNRVLKLFRDGSYTVKPGRTDLPQHSEGVWLNGGTFNDQIHAKWGLSTLGIEPRIDNSGDKPEHFQVIVGAFALRDREVEATSLERMARDLRHPGNMSEMFRRQFDDQATDLERAAAKIRVGSALSAIYKAPEPVPGASESAIAAGLNFRVFIIPNPGGTPGGSLKAVNENAEAVEGVTITVTDLRVWDDKRKQFVTHPDIYGQNKTFPQAIVLNHKHTLHCGVPADYGLMRVERNRLEINGHPRDYKTQKDGIWEMRFRIGPDDRTFIASRICFVWKASDETVKQPTLEECECPFSYGSF